MEQKNDSEELFEEIMYIIQDIKLKLRKQKLEAKDEKECSTSFNA